MSQQKQKNRRIIVLLFAMSVVPFIIAWFLASQVSWMGKGTNLGDLVTPPIQTKTTDFSGFDSFSKENIDEIPGHWIMIHIITQNDCQKSCLDAIHKSKQIRLMMNKDLTRIRRLVLLNNEVKNNPNATNWWQDDKRLLRVIPSSSLISKLQTLRHGNLSSDILFLMDPLGNIMMQYDSGFDPYQVKKDLGKLLRISQIG